MVSQCVSELHQTTVRACQSVLDGTVHRWNAWIADTDVHGINLWSSVSAGKCRLKVMGREPSAPWWAGLPRGGYGDAKQGSSARKKTTLPLQQNLFGQKRSAESISSSDTSKVSPDGGKGSFTKKVGKRSSLLLSPAASLNAFSTFKTEMPTFIK